MTAAATTKKLNERKYVRLLTSHFAPRPIGSETDYESALKVINALMDKGEDLSPEEDAMINLFVLLVEVYEDEHYPMPKIAQPVDFLKHFMEVRGTKQIDLLPVFGSKSVISEVVNGKRSISKAHARKLADFFNVSADLFI